MVRENSRGQFSECPIFIFILNKDNKQEALQNNINMQIPYNQWHGMMLLLDQAMAKGTTERVNGVNDLSKKYKVDVTASSDEDQQDSRKGRSKLERWTSHQERDFATLKKPSSSLLAVKKAEKYNSNVHSVDNNDKHLDPEENHLSLGDTKEVGDLETKNAEPTTVDDNDNNNKHLETVEKLKKRSERFKLRMPSEKETVVVKKMENEPLPSTQEDAPPDLEIKSEAPLGREGG